MAVGIQITKPDVDAMFGGICRDMNVLMRRIQDATVWLASQSDAQLIALGYAQAEVNTLRSAISATTGLDNLRAVYQGLATVAVAQDFRTFAKQLGGFNV